MTDVRAGTHNGYGVTAFRYITPRAANRSNDGVGIPISEYIRNADHFNWSAMMKRTFGRFNFVSSAPTPS